MKVFDNFFEKIYDKNIALTGMTEELFAVYVNKLYDSKKNILIVTSHLICKVDTLPLPTSTHPG